MKTLRFIVIVVTTCCCISLSGCAQECGKHQHAPSPSSVNPIDAECLKK